MEEKCKKKKKKKTRKKLRFVKAHENTSKDRSQRRTRVTMGSPLAPVLTSINLIIKFTNKNKKSL